MTEELLKEIIQRLDELDKRLDVIETLLESRNVTEQWNRYPPNMEEMDFDAFKDFIEFMLKDDWNYRGEE